MVKWRDALEDAQIYLNKAQNGFENDPGRITVSLCSPSLVRASDSLFLFYRGETPSNHDSSPA